MIKHIHFIGFGMMAASLASAIRKHEPGIYLSAESLDKGPETGMRHGFLDEISLIEDFSENLPTLVVLATPMGAMPAQLERLAKISHLTAITDIGSVKGELAQKAAELNLNYFGGHPMTGSEKQSATAFNPFLFENSVFVLTPPARENSVFDDYRNLIEKIGAWPLLLESTLHDQVAAAISHLPQLLAVSLVNFVASRNVENPAYLQLAAGGFRDMTRIASSPHGIWRDIIQSNRKVLGDTASDFVHHLTTMIDLVQAGELDEISTAFQKARATRDSIPRNTKGFLNPLFDLFVLVEDKPGVIFNMSRILFEQGINIRDMELLKVREGQQGAFRLSFSSETDWNAAHQLLNQSGFQSTQL